MTLILFRNIAIYIGMYFLAFLVLYFVIKWAVKNGIKEAFRDMKGTTCEEKYIENLQEKFNENKNEVE